MCGNNVTRKYWLIADRPNEAKKCGPFSPLVQILWGGAPLFLHPCAKVFVEAYVSCNDAYSCAIVDVVCKYFKSLRVVIA